ncbi:MAG: Plug domain-containing protein, partial [Sedimentisphaerales bacterium]
MSEAKNKDYNLRCVRHITIFLLILSAFSFNTLGANVSDSNDLFNLSLEQLMNVDVYAASTLTERNPRKTPASVTTITSRDIALTPARNILDLIEIYVPGAMYMAHSGGPLPGIRGFLVDRPYKYLVNVNGINVNIKPIWGARLELLNWELSDIDRIEVVRGPGSVIYGPGAIGGVINIYTKRGKQAPGFEIGGQYWGKYDSRGNYVSYGYNKDQFDLYTY